MTKEDTYLLTAYDGFGKKEALPKGALVGRVVNVTAGGKTFHPLKNENALSGFWGRLTEYGTQRRSAFSGNTVPQSAGGYACSSRPFFSRWSRIRRASATAWRISAIRTSATSLKRVKSAFS